MVGISCLSRVRETRLFIFGNDRWFHSYQSDDRTFGRERHSKCQTPLEASKRKNAAHSLGGDLTLRPQRFFTGLNFPFSLFSELGITSIGWRKTSLGGFLKSRGQTRLKSRPPPSNLNPADNDDFEWRFLDALIAEWPPMHTVHI